MFSFVRAVGYYAFVAFYAGYFPTLADLFVVMSFNTLELGDFIASPNSLFEDRLEFYRLHISLIFLIEVWLKAYYLISSLSRKLL